jgi:hypothetical protein
MSERNTPSRRGFLLASAGAFAMALGCQPDSLRQSSPPSTRKGIAPPPIEVRPAIDFSRAWLFFVGVLEWQDPAFESFPKDIRRDGVLVDALIARGVPKDQVVFLVDRAATKARIESKLRATLAKTKPGDTLWLYYAGHGDDDANGTHFMPFDVDANDYGTAWSVTSIVDEIERSFRGDVAVLTADCCSSGALADEVETRTNAGVSYAVLASVRTGETSTDAWTYTDCLIDGVRGDRRIDFDGDDVVTFDELRVHTELQLAMIEDQRARGCTTKGFSPKTVIAPARGPKTTPPPSPRRQARA